MSVNVSLNDTKEDKSSFKYFKPKFVEKPKIKI